MPDRPLRVLFATSECEPWVKTGGLADVAGALTAQLHRDGVDVRVLMPAYGAIDAQGVSTTRATPLPAFAGLPAASLEQATLPGGTPVLLVRCAPLFGRDGNPYVDAAGRDWSDNAQRFALLSRCASWLASDASALPWRPDVLHCNDWQTAPAAASLHFAAGARAKSLLTIHNLAFQGVFDGDLTALLGLPASAFAIDGVEWYGRTSFMKAGLVFADAVSTVSPTYAQQIQRAPLGFGLEGVIASRRGGVAGILNGIDTQRWDPAADPLIDARYDAQSLDRKRQNKAALQRAMGLRIDERTPLLGVVSRLTTQKGSDLIAGAAPAIVARGAQLVLLGAGDSAIERVLASAASAHEGAIGVRIGFDESLAHRIEAGADAFLMPSRFEPCGLNQMYSQRYGTPPIARATGGLADSIVDATPRTLADGTATGFLFEDETVDALLAAIERALTIYAEPRAWRAMQRAGMAQAFGWADRAREYRELYRTLLGATAGA